jgi:hypothetical protein
VHQIARTGAAEDGRGCEEKAAARVGKKGARAVERAHGARARSAAHLTRPTSGERLLNCRLLSAADFIVVGCRGDGVDSGEK